MQELKRLARHGATYGVAEAISRLAGFLLIPVYTSYLQTEDYGRLQIISITIELIGIFISFGISDAIYRFYFEQKNEKDKKTIVSSGVITVSVLATIIVLIISQFGDELSLLLFGETESSKYIKIAFVTLLFGVFHTLLLTYFRLMKKSLIYLILSVCKLILTLSVIITLVAYYEYGLIGVFVGNMVTAVVFGSAGLLYLYKKIGIHYSLSKVREMASYSLPIIPAYLSMMVINVSDRYIVKMILGLSDVAIYTLGYKLGNVIHYFVRVPFMQIWLPRRYELYHSGAEPEMFSKIATYYIGLMFWSGLAVSVLVHDVIKVISSNDYWDAAQYAPAIALCYVIYGLDQHLSFGIHVAKKTKYLSYINTVVAVLNIILNWYLITAYGIWGAVIATFLSFVIRNVALYFYGKRFYSIPFEWNNMLKLLLISMVLYLLKYLTLDQSMLISLVIDIVLIISFIPLVVAFKAIDESEIKIIKNKAAIYVRKLQNYLSS
ncbi:MAG: oligosaccharide flippase family protein [Candidatus Thiodiazotropha weberae]|nr:oligosaccharide flippase family protein [Candidatus Thiodiazotropha lotti]MCG8012610.1 oligosaccharide flippase family protein [Candidatus Thiodiazotropha lotti]MCW4212081.1 oligosaccharide flippase family protein [Candidatus Thiodiazotropha lotti]MCW4215889.1 oligosaccharide flippase family protein [Candidatus Thiodiazotropha lotti]